MADDWRRTIAWLALDEPRIEHAALSRGPRGFETRGRMAGAINGAPAWAAYRLELDHEWQTRRLRAVHSVGGAAGRLLLRRDEDGVWGDHTGERPDLAGCTDVDLAWTPLTNTLPIRRLGLAVGESRAISVAYVAPDLSVSPDGQRYTRLAPHRWRFDSLDSDFTAELTVDGDGLVIDYPPLFRRVAYWEAER